MPRKLEERNRRRGYMYFKASEISSRMSLNEILDVVFSGVKEYKRAAKVILEGVKNIAKAYGRRPLWISNSEMSNLIIEGLGRNKKSLAYRVIAEFLVPMGFLSYRPDEGKYYLSREFQLALNRLGKAYNAWVKK